MSRIIKEPFSPRKRHLMSDYRRELLMIDYHRRLSGVSVFSRLERSLIRVRNLAEASLDPLHDCSFGLNVSDHYTFAMDRSVNFSSRLEGV